MNYNINNRIKQIHIENYIWLLYLVIIGLSFYANYKEEDFFLHKNINSKEEYRKINAFIFILLIMGYLYFEKEAINSLKSTNPSRIKFDILSLIGSSFVLVSGIIFLYIILEDENLDEEIAFN